MRTLSTGAGIAYSLGLATCFGGLLFGKTALNPSLSSIASEADHGRVVTIKTQDKAGKPLEQDQNSANGNQPKTWFFTVRN